MPVLVLSALVTFVSLQAGCSDGDDDCKFSRGACHESSASHDETFLDKLNPFD